MMLRMLLAGYWLFVNLITFIVLIASLTSMRRLLLVTELSEYGKLRRSSSQKESQSSLLRLLRVPKRSDCMITASSWTCTIHTEF